MANHLSQSLGQLQQLVPTSQGFVAHTEQGSLEVAVYAPSVLRVRANRTPETRDDFSYAVVAEAQACPFDLVDHGTHWRLSTSALRLEVGKNPLRLRFFNPQGHLLNEDEPGLGTAWIGDNATVYKKLQANEKFVGLGEKTGNLDRRGSGFSHWNTDFFGYGPESDPIYASLPFYLGLLPPEGHTPGRAYGIFMDSPVKSHFNFGASNRRFASFTVEEGEMNYYFFHAPTVAGILEDYAQLTGLMPMPPLWSLGYQQCRYSYYPDSEVLTLARTFRDKKIPADVIYLDIHYMDAYKIFSWDKNRFPDPEGMIAQLREMGFRTAVICDPGIKIEEGYEAYKSGLNENVFIKYPDGELYEGQVWPGWCNFPDFTKPEGRAWWGQQFESYVAQGLRGFWNDMNEPATWGQKLPDLVEFDYEGQKATARKARNIYGLQMARATYEGARQHLGNERPFVLTRAGYCGIQRYSALWTGDNTSSDEHMLAGVRLVNSLGLTGVPFAGYDVGGFVGEASSALFARWISVGAFSPFFRGHTMINTRDQEPWAFGEEVEDIARNYIQLRYNLLPYLYSVFYEASRSGLPVARSLALDYTFEEEVYDTRFQNQYLLGPWFLVAPVESTRDISKIYLPPGDWFYLYDGQPYQGGRTHLVESPLEFLPVFVKAGAIVPMQSPVQHTGEHFTDVLQIHLYEHSGSSDFVYYEDDGTSYQHEQGQYYKRSLVYNGASRQFVLEPVEGGYASRFHYIKLVFHGFGPWLADALQLNGEPLSLLDEETMFVPPVSSFDPLGKQSMVKKERTPVAIFAASAGRQEVSW